ncbi:MAG: nucleoside phosphorylase [Candidatus Cloacimonetes bacterium]|nr:nucleoside phosphorylase [Candidatus Cloacimonadota bacterium]
MQQGLFNEASGPWDHLKQIGDIKDEKDPSLMTPEKMLRGIKLPEGFLADLCYLIWPKPLVTKLLSQGRKIRSYQFYSYTLDCLEVGGRNIGLVFMPMGAAAAVMVFEELISLGFQRFVGIGTAGGIHSDLKSADLCLMEQAIIDEGVSAHYGNREFFSHGSFRLMNQVQKILSEKEFLIRKGCVWTTDAPYRETSAKLAFMKKKQILCVDMETSALFTVSRYHKVSYTALLGIADLISSDQWIPCPDMNQVFQNLSSCAHYLFQNPV